MLLRENDSPPYFCTALFYQLGFERAVAEFAFVSNSTHMKWKSIIIQNILGWSRFESMGWGPISGVSIYFTCHVPEMHLTKLSNRGLGMPKPFNQSLFLLSYSWRMISNSSVAMTGKPLLLSFSLWWDSSIFSLHSWKSYTLIHWFLAMSGSQQVVLNCADCEGSHHHTSSSWFVSTTMTLERSWQYHPFMIGQHCQMPLW